MRKWSLKPGDPLSLTLAADVRFGPIRYHDDQIWELTLKGGDPASLAFQTTYGLRARALRLFPRFTEGDITLTDPADFSTAPVVTQIYSNFLTVELSPFSGIDVRAEYWIPDSSCAAGRISLSNSGNKEHQIRLDWSALLSPTEGQRMAVLEYEAVQVLTGKTGGLEPVIFVTGGPQAGSGSFPSLALTFVLKPDETQQVTWTAAACPTLHDSFVLARSQAARNWEAEKARIEILNSGSIEIYTGNPDWDVALMLSQNQAHRLMVGPTPSLPAPSFVFTRQPDQGYSIIGTGSDYNHLWNGQTPLEANFLAGYFLPSSPHLVEGLIRNFLSTQADDGSVDWKPGLGGQRSRFLATPILANLAWRCYEFTQDRLFLEEVFPGILLFVRSWFQTSHDRDSDGVPEWDNPMQAGAEDHPLYSRWQDHTYGIEISTSESPALCSFLIRECQALQQIATEINRSAEVEDLQSFANHLYTAIETSWDPQSFSYSDWDRDTHQISHGEFLGERKGPGSIQINRLFEDPKRVLIHIRTLGETTRRPQVFLHGTSASGNHRVEAISEDRFRWFLGRGVMTGERVYLGIERIEILGLDSQDTVTAMTVENTCQEIRHFLPLWGQIPDADRAETLVEKMICAPEKFWQPAGLPIYALQSPHDDEEPCQEINILWNEFIGEGLLKYGYRREAAELVKRLMTDVVENLKTEGSFRRTYKADTGQGQGERNSISGLAPIHLFLQTLGVRVLTQSRVFLQGFNPFPWPVTVKYRGLTILRQREKTMVIFPDGQTQIITDPEPVIVSLETRADHRGN